MQLDSTERRSTPWTALRSVLFVPATSTHLLAKAARRGADALVLDLEDAVPRERKDEARQNLKQAVQILDTQVPVLVRINADIDLRTLDIQSLPLSRIAAVMLPKVESAQQVQAIAAQLEIHHPEGKEVPIIALIETPLGVLRLESIAAAHGSIVALGFGAEDYVAEMSIEPTSETVSWAAQAVANCAHAFRLACLGLPGSVTETRDMDAYGALVARARDIGFTGTVCIHPVQVPIANRGFSPSEAQLTWARAVVAAGEKAEADGVGAVVLDGRMLDRPIIERARQWLSRS